MDDKVYFTERLSLKLTSLDDAEFILQLMNSEPWLKNIGDREVYTVESAREYIKEKMLVQSILLGYGNYTISLSSTAEKVGTCGIYDRKGLDGVDIGFALLPEFENKGYAYEASTKILDIALNEYQLEKVNGITTEDNIQSRKLLSKLNLKEIGKVELKNDLSEFLLYQIKREEYLK